MTIPTTRPRFVTTTLPMDRPRILRPWITNEYLHDGLRTGGEDLLGRLFDLARGKA